MSTSLDMGFGQHMDMRPSPSLIQFAEILAMTAIEMQQAVHQAVADNPALELSEVELCPACGDPLLADGTCFRCRSGDDLSRHASRDLTDPEDEAFDPLTRVADQRSLSEHLLAELALVLAPDDLPIAEYLVGELDDRGFLETPLEIVANSLEVPLVRVDRVLEALQSVGPLGIGARSVSECLTLQMDRWEEAGVSQPIARILVERHLDELARGRYGQLARELEVAYDEVIAARDFIRSHLRPYPIAESVDLAPWEHQEGPGYIAPDVIVRRGKAEQLEVEIVESRRYVLSITPLYRKLCEQLDAAGADKAAGLSKKDRRHIRTQVNRASEFLSHIQERRDTMRRVAAYVMARQSEYLRRGPRYLVHLTRAEVAEALALHESTVSRATSNKYVLLPDHHIVPFSHFFKVALSVHDVLRELVDGETKPLTDTELAAELQKRGFTVARRTVAKYRDRVGILPSSLR